MYDIVTFGSGTRDVYLISKDFLIMGEKKFITGKGLCLSLGSKIEVENIMFKSGGGGTNTAATFKNQGLKVVWCGMVGDDIGGRAIIEHLKNQGISTRFVFQSKNKPTNYSVILTVPGQERTILVYRGASGELTEKNVPWSKLETKWFYLAPLSGRLCSIFERVIDFAKKNKIKVAINPGHCQLSLPPQTLKNILQQIDILILNQEEASFLTKIPFGKEKEILEKLDTLVKGIIVITKGSEGVVVSDGRYLYRAETLKFKVIDRTGAGDSFGSGFVSGFIKTKNIEKAIQLGIANASTCLQNWGAKEGLLKKGQKYPLVKIVKYKK